MFVADSVSLHRLQVNELYRSELADLVIYMRERSLLEFKMLDPKTGKYLLDEVYLVRKI